jgi:hypothetical protein
LEFGFLCCQRHETARQCLMVLALLAGAGALPLCPDDPAWRRRVPAGIACLGLALAPMVYARAPDLLYAYRHAASSRAHLATLWRTGFAPDPQPAVLQQSDAKLVHAWTFPAGDHRVAAPRSDVAMVMGFFRKHEVIVLPPGAPDSVSYLLSK